ncbi:MAG: hypothetical protein J0L92_24335 [Deltaproteobacteria bacterium]|nr:hypothetical protein [Deltaproteobacteria bacterium]
MRPHAILVVVESEGRSQLGKRLNVSSDQPVALVVERGEARLEPTRGATDRRMAGWIEPVGRKLFVHAVDPRVRRNGADVPPVGALLSDGDELELGPVRVRVRMTDDLEAAYHETVYGLADKRHAVVDRHAN